MTPPEEPPEIPLNVRVNEFFKQTVPPSIRQNVDVRLEDAAFVRTEFDTVSLLTAPPGSPGVPRPLWLVILGSTYIKTLSLLSLDIRNFVYRTTQEHWVLEEEEKERNLLCVFFVHFVATRLLTLHLVLLLFLYCHCLNNLSLSFGGFLVLFLSIFCLPTRCPDWSIVVWLLQVFRRRGIVSNGIGPRN